MKKILKGSALDIDVKERFLREFFGRLEGRDVDLRGEEELGSVNIQIILLYLISYVILTLDPSKIIINCIVFKLIAT